MKTLLFEAESGVRQSLAAILVARGHDLTVCATAAEAMAAALSGSFDLLLLDWSTADRGPAVSRLARTRPGNRACLVVALVGVDDREEVTAALASGAEDFLVCSPDAATLVAWLAVMEARVEERAAVEKERLVLRALMDHFPGNIYFKDAESRFTRTNRAFAEYVGIKDPAEVVGKTDFDIFSAEHAKQAFEDEQAVIRTGQPLLHVEEKETWRDGRETWVSTSKAPLLDAEARVVGTFGVSLDISKRKRAEAALRESEERYALAVRGANDGIWDWDLRQNRIYYSPRWKAMLGLERGRRSAAPARRVVRPRPPRRPAASAGRDRAALDGEDAALRGRAPDAAPGRRAIAGCWAAGFAVRDADGRRLPHGRVADRHHRPARLRSAHRPAQPRPVHGSPRGRARPGRAAGGSTCSPCCSSTSTASRWSTTASGHLVGDQLLRRAREALR